MIEDKLGAIAPLMTGWDYLDQNRPALRNCVCGGQPQCFHDEDTAFGVECYACGRHVSGYKTATSAINAWNEMVQADFVQPKPVAHKVAWYQQRDRGDH